MTANNTSAQSATTTGTATDEHAALLQIIDCKNNQIHHMQAQLSALEQRITDISTNSSILCAERDSAVTELRRFAQEVRRLIDQGKTIAARRACEKVTR